MCTNGTAPSVSSINRILRNRAAERAAAEFARAAGYGLYQVSSHPYASFPWPPHAHGLWPGASPADGASAVAAAAAAGLPHRGPTSGGGGKGAPPLQLINVHQPCTVMSSRDLMPRLMGEYRPRADHTDIRTTSRGVLKIQM